MKIFFVEIFFDPLITYSQICLFFVCLYEEFIPPELFFVVFDKIWYLLNVLLLSFLKSPKVI
jgi:hypothetical protein